MSIKITNDRFACMHDIDISVENCSECASLLREYPDNGTGFNLVVLPDGTEVFVEHMPSQCVHSLSFEDDCGPCARINYVCTTEDELTDEEQEEAEAYFNEDFGEVEDANGNFRVTTSGDYYPSKPLVFSSKKQIEDGKARQAEWERNRRSKDESKT